MILVDVSAVLALTTGSFALATMVADAWAALLVYNAVAGAGLMAAVALPLRHFLLEQRRHTERREAILVRGCTPVRPRSFARDLRCRR